jgi:hypothetical protein
MSAGRREAWGSLRKLPSGRWQVRYPGPDGATHTARTQDDSALTFQSKMDARAWLAATHTAIVRGEWEAPSVGAERRRAQKAADELRTVGFREYAERWLAMVRDEPNRSGKKRAAATARAYRSKVEDYLVPELGDTPVRAIDLKRIREITVRLDKIPSVLNRGSERNGVTRPVLVVLMMILARQRGTGSSLRRLQSRCPDSCQSATTPTMTSPRTSRTPCTSRRSTRRPLSRGRS